MPAAVAANPLPFIERVFILNDLVAERRVHFADRLFFRKVLFLRDAAKDPSIGRFSGTKSSPFTSMLRSLQVGSQPRLVEV
jgi:hypothetical protein